MPIELLYIIPILALAVLVYLLVLNAQKRAAAGGANAPSSVVAAPKAGDTRSQQAVRSTEDRLNEYEQTIAQINKTLAAQQNIIDKSQEENSSYNTEIEKLNAKLRELHKEYDIVISENYSLRAKVKSLQKKTEAEGVGREMVDPASDQLQPHRTDGAREDVEMNMNLYDDTRLFKASSLLDDTSEFEAADQN
jgi:septal ring factor EnvC (AmiA/AmiB activator)